MNQYLQVFMSIPLLTHMRLDDCNKKEEMQLYQFKNHLQELIQDIRVTLKAMIDNLLLRICEMMKFEDQRNDH